ncbi:hypothetical protein [Psychrobacter sp. DAB_AL62B]|uniref:hypothetical protein n=1 Tax=Psychrobacter sp. DAB_AL62B TaxID=1028420 RepID=UPI0023817EE2|nr:hypothetical protein [Psychrobacter sp. DAB_AL62B]MDE4455372.1 hypothetical protein [Psychrobacter sp. DAB_AL62B]
MSYTSLPAFKLFQLTSLSCALALAGCGGGDGTDVIAPTPDLGPEKPGTGGGNNNGGGTTNPTERPDFFLQAITINPSNIEISDNQDEQTEFTATVKALQVAGISGVSDQEVTLKVADSENSGAVTIERQGIQLTDESGNAVYELKLNPQAIKDEAALLRNGFTLIATSKKADGTIVEQIRSVPVSRKGAGGGSQVIISDLIIKSDIQTTSVSNNKLNALGDTAVFSVIVEDKNKVRAQGVTVGLGLASTDGVSIIGGNSKVTDTNGIATFNIKLEEGLSKEVRDALIQQGVTYSISIKEKNGATKQQLKELPVALPISDYNLKVDGVTNAINAYGDTKKLTVTASPINSKVPTQINGAQVSIKLNNAPEGVSLATEQLVLDATGKATVDLNVSPTLDDAARQKLAKEGISYTIILSEPNRSTTVKTFTNQVYIPQAQYQVSFVSNGKNKISSYGSSTIVTFRVIDRSNGGPIANQNVTATLPKALRDAGLLTLESDATQKTDAQGLVKYTIRIPSNLSADKRAVLEQADVSITATMKEASGVISSVTSTKVQVTAESETVITSKTVPSIVNVLKDQFQIQVSGKRPDGSTATGKEVKLIINNIDGISVQGNTQTTDNAGNATFTVNIAPSLTREQREALTKLVIPYTVTLTDDDGIVTKNDTFKVAMPTADYRINFGTSSNDQLSSSGDSTVISFRVNDENGGVIANQRVTAVLPKALIDAGLLTLDSAATQVTDAKGMVSYKVSVPAGLTTERKAQLEKTGGFALTAAIIEESGASSTATSERVRISNEIKVSATTLSSTSIPSVVNVLKDSFKIQVSGRRPNGNVAAGKLVKLTIDNVKGVSVQGNTQTTDTAGNATFIVNIDPSLTKAQREALVTSGIGYTAILTDDDGIATQKGTAKAAMPVADYRINFGTSSNDQLSSSGGSTTISFRVNDKKGGVIANQSVTAVLPPALIDAGLLTLDSAATQITDNKGMVSYNVSVPAGLSAERKEQLEKIGGFALTATIVEESGASSTADSVSVRISDKVKVSETTLRSTSIPSVVNVLKDTFKIQVSGKRLNGNAAAGKVVKLTIDNVTGVSVQGNTQTTDAAGNATFIVNIDPTLSRADREALAASTGIAYTAILTDDDGIATQNATAKAAMPTADYRINFGTSSNDQLSSSGGSTTISFRVNDKKTGGVIANQRVTAELPEALREAGILILDGSASQATDNKGMVSYTVRVPAGLSKAQQDDLEKIKSFILTATIIEESGARSTVTSSPVRISDEVKISKTTLSSTSIPSVVNVLKDSFKIQVSGKRPNGSAAAGKVVKLTVDNVKGVSVQGNEQTTDAAGNATFIVNIDPSLTRAQREALADSTGIAYTAILTDDDGIATQKYNAKAAMPVADYQINFGTSSNDQLSSSGGSTTISFRVNDKGTGGVIANQRVTAVLPKALRDAGLLTLDSAATQVTDNKGMVSYNVSVPAGLSTDQKKALEATGNFALTAAIIEDSGASSTATSAAVRVSDEVKVSATTLSSTSIPSVVNVLKDSFKIQVSGKRPNGNAAAGKLVKLTIDNVKGVSVQGNTQTTDAAGNATFVLNIDPTLSRADREALVASGIAYTAILTDDDGIATQNATAQAALPDAAYQINFGTNSNDQLSSSGGSTIISFRVNDKETGGVIANQRVTAVLPKALRDAGLLTLDSAATQVTDNKGMVSYTVRVPAGLSTKQKDDLETAGSFALTAAIIEDSGVSSTVTSTPVLISDKVAVSATTLSSASIPSVVNVLKDSFKIQVSGKRPNGNAAAGKVVTLAIDNVSGVSIEGNEQTTNAAGNATFTVNIDPSLTRAQREALVTSGIGYTAILTDDDGIATQNATATAAMPDAAYKINFGTTSNNQLSSSGGSTVISFRVNDKKTGGVIANQSVTAELPEALREAGILIIDSAATKLTDAQGMVSYTVRVPAGLNADQKKALEAAGSFILIATIIEESGAISEVASTPVLISDKVAVSATTLSSASIPSVVNVLKDSFKIQVSGKRPNGNVAAGKVVKLTIEDVFGVSIQGNEQTTDAAGNATFTVNIDPSLTKAQREALAASGIAYTAILTDDDGIATENATAQAGIPDAQYQLNVGTNSNSQLSSSGGSTVISFRVNDKTTGGVIANQRVSVVLPKALRDAGLLTLDSEATKPTDAQGMVSYTVRVPAGLSTEQKKALEDAVSFKLTAAIIENSGVSSTVESTPVLISDEVKVSATTLSSTSIPSTVNILKDSFKIQVSGKRPNGSAAASKVVKLTIDNVSGVSIEGNEQTTDAAGNATFMVNIDPSLTRAQRDALVASGIAYTAILTDDDGIATENATAQAAIPDAAYQINFGINSNSQLLSSGGSTVISFRVNDKQGGVIAGQSVTSVLPSALIDAGLLTLDSAATQITDDKGMVSYTVRVPSGLSKVQRDKLEGIGGFVLTATNLEESGASSKVESERVLVKDKAALSDIVLTSISTPKVVNTSDSQFNIQVSGKRSNGSAASGKVVKLALDKILPGVSIEGNEQTTNAAGNAVFTLNISQNLTPSQRDALVASGISYTATLIDDDKEAKISDTVTVQQPATSIDFASIRTPTISELGGNGSITVKLLTKDAAKTPVNGQKVDIVLGAKARDYGVTLSQTSATTDFNGEATYIIDVPTGLTRKQRDELKKIGINYQLSYVEKGITYNSKIRKVNLFQPAIVLSILNAPTNIGNRDGYTLNEVGDSITIQGQLSNKTDNTQIASQSVELNFNDKSLAKLLTVNGNAGSATIVANTDTDGIVSFEVVVPSNLTPDEKQALRDKVLTATLKETLTNQEQEVNIKVQSMVANISLIDTQSNPLNLNGGETQIEVTAENDKGNVVAGQKVFLALPALIASQGVTLVSGNSQTTDDSGRATFTLAVPNNLTTAQKEAIEGATKSFVIVFSAADASGNIVTQSSTVNTITPDATTGIKENLTIGANKVVNTKGDTFKVFVRVAKNDGSSIANREVRLNVDDPIKTGVTITNNAVTTNGDGVATFDLKLEAGANVNQAILEAGIKLMATTTTADNLTLEQQYIVAVDKATIDSYQILASSEKSTLRTGGDQTTATFRVTDSRGGILVGVPLQLSIENLEASGAALTTPSVVTTDVSGKVDVGVLLAAGTVNARLNHSVVINAKIVTPRYDANGDVTMEVREDKSLSLSAIGTEITLSATETKLKDGGLATITTRLIDGSGRAIANAGMELVNSDDELITTNATTTTNADGEASFDINEANLTFDSNGNLRVFARAVGEGGIVVQRSNNSIELVKISQAGISFIDIENLYDVNEPQLINVQIRADSPEKALELVGKEVEVQTTIGSLIPNYLDKFTDKVIVSKPIQKSDIQGSIITVKVWLKSELAGTAVLQATVLGENVNGQPRYRAIVDTRFRATTPTKMLFQAVKSVITPGGSTEVVATVKDKNDVPVEGQTVVFSRIADSSAGRLSSATAITDSKGQARVVYQANASSPIGGVVINARLLIDNAGIGLKTTNITVSEDAVYTTLSFGNKLASDDIYYTVRGSISVMDGSGRAVPNKEVSIKSYAVEYAQGKYCLLDSTVSYQASSFLEDGNIILPALKTSAEKVPVSQTSSWIDTEDGNYNYTLDKDSNPILNEDKNNNGSLEAINPVAIIGGTLSDDGYSFVTDDEGRADFEIRYPLRYSNWVKVKFDATTFLNGSESTQSINYQLPSAEKDLVINGSDLSTPWIDNTSPFGNGGATCVNSMNVSIQEQDNLRTPNVPASTKVTLSPYQPAQSNYFVSINGVSGSGAPGGFNTYMIDFNEAFALGSVVSVSNNGFSFNRVIKAQ